MKLIDTYKQLLSERIVNIYPKDLLNWFLERSNKHTFVFFDTETTGLWRHEGNQITQVGAIAAYFNPETLRFAEIGKFNKYVKLNDEIKSHVDSEEDVELPDDPKELENLKRKSKRAILKFNHYDLDKSATYDDELTVLAEFEDFLDGHSPVILLAHNAPFDLRYVEISEMFKSADREVFDTMDFFKSIFFPILTSISNKDTSVKDFLDKQPTKSSGLVNLVKRFSDPSELEGKLNMAHEAVQDCRNTMEVFEKGLQRISHYLSGK